MEQETPLQNISALGRCCFVCDDDDDDGQNSCAVHEGGFVTDWWLFGWFLTAERLRPSPTGQRRCVDEPGAHR